MPEHFRPIVVAVHGFLTAVNNFTSGLTVRPTDDKRKVNAALEAVQCAVNRAIAVGFPKAPDRYSGGEAGWKFDLERVLGQIKRTGEELAAFAVTFPDRPRLDLTTRDVQELRRRQTDWDVASKQLKTLKAELEKQRGELLRLQKLIPRPTKARPEHRPSTPRVTAVAVPNTTKPQQPTHAVSVNTEARPAPASLPVSPLPSVGSLMTQGRTSTSADNLARAQAELAAQRDRERLAAERQSRRDDLQSLVQSRFAELYERWTNFCQAQYRGFTCSDSFDVLLSAFGTLLTNLTPYLIDDEYRARWLRADHESNFRNYCGAEVDIALRGGGNPALHRARYDEAVRITTALFDGTFTSEDLRPAMQEEALRGVLSYLCIILRGVTNFQRFEMCEAVAPAPTTVTAVEARLGQVSAQLATSKASEQSQPDGPFEPRGFRWKGREEEFPKGTKRHYRFAIAAWQSFRSRQPWHLDQVNTAYEKAGGSPLSADAAENYARELSNQLIAWFPNFPAEFKRDGERHFRWFDRSSGTS